jgi:hypothetical protein
MSTFNGKTLEERRAYWRIRRDTQDADVPENGVEKSARINLGLELLSIARKPGTRFSYFDIALWCGCTDGMIYLTEKRALKKLGNALRFGRGRGVGAELRDQGGHKTNRMTAEETRAALARFNQRKNRRAA